MATDYKKLQEIVQATVHMQEVLRNLEAAFKTSHEALTYFGEMDSEADWCRWGYVRDWLLVACRTLGMDVNALMEEAEGEDFSPFAPKDFEDREGV